jgi:protein SCO1/2
MAGTSCDRPQPAPAGKNASGTATNTQVFQVKGVVREVAADGQTVRIKHEAIPDYMPAMTMEFRPADTNQLKGLTPGDRISFSMMVTEDSGWIDNIRRIGRDESALATNAAPPAAAPDATLKAGDLVPDIALTNELGAAISLGQYRGQALAFTFIFTRCPFPEFCPRMANHFQGAAEILSRAAGGPTNWHLLSLSFDPDYDTPAVLKSYAAAHQYDPAHWSFATSSSSNILRLARLCDLTVQRDGAGFTHNLRTVVVDTEGRVRNILVGNDWTPRDLANDLTAAAQATNAAAAR